MPERHHDGEDEQYIRDIAELMVGVSEETDARSLQMILEKITALSASQLGVDHFTIHVIQNAELGDEGYHVWPKKGEIVEIHVPTLTSFRGDVAVFIAHVVPLIFHEVRHIRQSIDDPAMYEKTYLTNVRYVQRHDNPIAYITDPGEHEARTWTLSQMEDVLENQSLAKNERVARSIKKEYDALERQLRDSAPLIQKTRVHRL